MSESQVVLITGCSSGIGNALATTLARQGHTVVATARRLDSLAGLEAAGKVVKLALDVNDPDGARACVAEAIAKVGAIDILVNNAGMNVVGPLAEVPLDDVDDILVNNAGMNVVGPLAEVPLDDVDGILRTNVVGVLAMVQAVVPHMARAGRGRIVNIGSMIGVIGTPFTGAYCASKAAVHMLSDVLRLELRPLGIDVVSVEPGRVRSNIAKNARNDMGRYERDGSLYQPWVDGIRRRHGASQVGPTDTNEFAEKVARAITRARAPRVVRYGRGSLMLPLLRRVAPGGLLDWACGARSGCRRGGCDGRPMRPLR